MAAWITSNQRSNLIQNCDLPPPQKLFSGPDETFLSSVSKIYNMDGGKDCSGENDKLELLKALQLSQTRAREAERNITVLSKEKEVLSNMMIRDSLRVFAYRRWVSLTEIQVMKLQRKQQDEDDDDEDDGSRILCAAFAFCLAVAGMGFAFGCRYLF